MPTLLTPELAQSTDVEDLNKALSEFRPGPAKQDLPRPMLPNKGQVDLREVRFGCDGCHTCFNCDGG